MGSCSLGKKMKDYGFSPKETKKKRKELYNLQATRFGAFHTSGNFSLAFKWNLIKAATTKGNNKRNEQRLKMVKIFHFFTTNYRMAFHLAFSPTTKAATKAPFTRRLNNNKWVELSEKKRFSVVAVVFEPKGNAFLCFSFGFYINAAPPSQKHRCKDTFFFCFIFQSPAREWRRRRSHGGGSNLI